MMQLNFLDPKSTLAKAILIQKGNKTMTEPNKNALVTELRFDITATLQELTAEFKASPLYKEIQRELETLSKARAILQSQNEIVERYRSSIDKINHTNTRADVKQIEAFLALADALGGEDE